MNYAAEFKVGFSPGFSSGFFDFKPWIITMPTLPELKQKLKDLEIQRSSELQELDSQEKYLTQQCKLQSERRAKALTAYDSNRASILKQIDDLSRPAIGKRVKVDNHKIGTVIARPDWSGLDGSDANYVYVAFDDFTWNGYALSSKRVEVL